VQLCDKTTHALNFESHKKKVGSCVPWLVAGRAANLLLQARFQILGVCRKFPSAAA
jgi:hypothetical protein